MASGAIRVLAVEDELLILMALQDMLSVLGCEVAASELTLEAALIRSRELVFDVAVLDVNLRGHRIDPVIEILNSRGIPFITTSGYSQTGMMSHAGLHLVKPYTVGDLGSALTRATGAEQAAPAVDRH